MVARIPDRNDHDAEGYRLFREHDLPKFTIQIPELEGALSDIREGIVVDVGCGLGDITAHMAAYTRSMAIGVDKSRAMLYLARQTNPYRHLHFVQAAGGLLPLRENFADATYSNMLLMEQSTKATLFEAILSMAMITKKGGIVAAVISNPYTVDRDPGNARRHFLLDSADTLPPLHPSHEGRQIQVTLLGQEGEELDSFTDYYWLPETYKAAFEAAGLEIEYQREQGYPRDIVGQYRIPQAFDFKHVMAIKARKV